MDLKAKGITWVGNIYQKFEAVCHENTVKYVEDQVHMAGESVKKLYSDVQDLLPPLVNPVKREAQAVAQKGNIAIRTYFKSMMGTEENRADSVIKQHLEPIVNDPVENQLTHAFAECDIVDKQASVISDDHRLSYSESYMDKNSDVRLRTNEDAIPETAGNTKYVSQASEVELDAITEAAPGVLKLVSTRDEEDAETSLLSELSDHQCENGCDGLGEALHETLIHSKEFALSQDEGTQTFCNGSSNDVLGFSPKVKTFCDNPENSQYVDASSSLTSAELASDTSTETATEVPELVSTCEESLFDEFDTYQENRREAIAEILPATLIQSVECELLQKGGSKALSNSNSFRLEAVCANFADDAKFVSSASSTVTSSDLASKVLTCENNIAETEPVSSCSSLSKESLPLSKGSPESLYSGATLCDHCIEDAVCIPGDSSALMTTALAESLSCDNNLVNIRRISSSSSLRSMQSFDDNGLEVPEIQSRTKSPANRHVEFYELTNSKVLLSSSETDLETIDLMDKVKLEDKCVMVESNAVHVVPFITQRHRSYKKRIQDVFASKKRLAKEYKLLSLWYGDNDLECSHDRLQRALPSTSTSTSTTLLNFDSQTIDACESEWEIL